MNLAHEFAIKTHGELHGARAYWDGSCIEFAGELLEYAGRGKMAYFDDPPNLYQWKYHAVAVIDGMVHDLWQDEEMTVDEYMEKIGAIEIEYTWCHA